MPFDALRKPYPQALQGDRASWKGGERWPRGNGKGVKRRCPLA